jgi:hypothetical protein
MSGCIIKAIVRRPPQRLRASGFLPSLGDEIARLRAPSVRDKAPRRHLEK